MFPLFQGRTDSVIRCIKITKLQEKFRSEKLTGSQEHIIVNTDCPRNYQSQTKSRKYVSIVGLNQGKVKFSIILLVIMNISEIKRLQNKTWPGTCSFPLYSAGSNGLPLAKIARPWRQTREQSQGTLSIIKGVMYRIILYLTPCISFSCCTLGLRSRVGECKYKRSLHSRN